MHVFTLLSLHSVHRLVRQIHPLSSAFKHDKTQYVDSDLYDLECYMCKKLTHTYIWWLVSPLESPCVGNWGILCHDVCVGLSCFRFLPWLHYRGTLPVNILKGTTHFIHLISMIIKQQTFVGSHSHHHEVELTISCAQSFKFKSDATKLCRRMARHRRGEPDGRCKQEGVELVMTKRNTPPSDERDGDWKTQRDLLEARNMDIQDEVVIIWASCSTLDMITRHLPA